MNRHIPDSAEVACNYPDLDLGTFERSVRLDMSSDQSGISLTLHRTLDTGVHQSVHLRFQPALFSEILAGLTRCVGDKPLADREQRIALCGAIVTLHRALAGETPENPTKTTTRDKRPQKQEDDAADLTPENAVLLLHVLE